MKIRINISKDSEYDGDEEIDLPAVPRIGESIKDHNNRYYKVTTVAYRPHNTNLTLIEVTLEKDYSTTP